MLRIIAGKYRNRLIEQPVRNTTRPTIDRVREAIFSSIQFDIEDKTFLDLFSGSGSFCLEALSRNAKSAICIEKDINAFLILNKNKKALNEENLLSYNTDAITYLTRMNNKRKFDFIYLDPPFIEIKLLLECLNIIHKEKILNEDGLILVETNEKNLNIDLSKFEVMKCKKYGKIYIYYLKVI